MNMTSRPVFIITFLLAGVLPLRAQQDIVIDVRFLPNPNYVPRLRRLTGLSPAVERYILGQPVTQRFLEDYLIQKVLVMKLSLQPRALSNIQQLHR